MQDNVLTLENENFQDDAELEGELYAVGTRGYSAYEVAVINGYIGTEEEWLASLEGEDGITPTIGDNGNWFLGDVDTGLPSRGEPGEDGEDGEDGQGVPLGGKTGQMLVKTSATDYDTAWVDSVSLGQIGDYSTTSNALRIDLLEENKVYVLFNTITSGTGHFYIGWEDNDVVLTKEIIIRAITSMPVFYFQRRKFNPSDTNYNVYMWRDYWYFSGGAHSFNRYVQRYYIDNNSIAVADVASSGCDVVTSDTIQTISAKKTFSVLPESSVVPTTNNQLVNKKYVDDSIPETFYIGNITDYNTQAKALNLDDLEEGKTYVIVNNLKPPIGGTDLYIKATSINEHGELTSRRALAYNKMTAPVYYVTKNIHTETLEDESTRTYYFQLYFPSFQLDLVSDYTIKTQMMEFYEKDYGSSWGLDYEGTVNKIYAVTTNTTQNISGKKTFTSNLPESSIVPTTDNQLTNKAYVDSKISQIDTLPTAASTNVGKIYQYTGTTDANYTNGYFYQCVSDGAATPTYSWEQLNVQPAGGSGNAFPTLELETFFNIINGGRVDTEEMRDFFDERITSMLTETPKIGIVVFKYDNNGKTEMWSCTSNATSQSTQYDFYLINTTTRTSGYDYALAVRGSWNNSIFTTNSVTTYQNPINAIAYKSDVLTKTNSSSYTPTSDYHPATKKYVDDNKGQTIQYSTMPTASADTVGKIVQYIGTTDSTYTNGYFYIGETDGESTPTYSWAQLDVQPSSGGGGDKDYIAVNVSAGISISTLKSRTDSTLTITNATVLNAVASTITALKDTGKELRINVEFLYTPPSGGSDYVATYGDTLITSSTGYMRSISAPVLSNPSGNIPLVYRIMVYMPGQWINGEYSLTQIQISYFEARILDGSNTATYVPSANYHPSTKIYSETTPLTTAGLSVYNTSSTYNTGDYVYRSSTDLTIYKCNTDNTTGSWNSSYWDSKTYLEYLSDNLGSGGGASYPVYPIELECTTTYWPFTYNFSANDKTNMANIINDAYAKGYKFVIFVIFKKSDVGDMFCLTSTGITPAWNNLQSKPSTFQIYGTSAIQLNTGSNGIIYNSKAMSVNLSWSGDTATVTSANINSNLVQLLSTDNERSYTPTSNYHPATKLYVDNAANPTVTTSSTSTYTIASLTGNQSYKLGEITALTITAVTTFDKESIIYFSSGSTGTAVTIPLSLINIGDVPTLTASGATNTGTCEINKSYIISVLNDIAIWKAY